MPKIDRLFICCISALDFRRINPERTPFLSKSLSLYPWARINTFPEVDLEPTAFTGVYPHQHGMWQVRLKNYHDFSLLQRIIDNIPDIITTTVQCLIHLFTGSFDLAAVPYWRRRRFEINKTKYMIRNVTNFLRFNGIETIFSYVGEKESNLIFNGKFDELFSLTPKLFSRVHRLEHLHIHSLDTFQHWNLDNPDRITKFYTKIDSFLEELYNRCNDKSINMMLLSDHGQEPVKSSIDIVNGLKRLGISKHEYTYFIEASKARFYFHSDRAREKILDLLSSIEHGTILSYKDMHEYNVRFEDKSYGEYYLILDPGYLFFPNDYYHPIGNIFLGLRDWQQRSRLTSPKYRGYHGYLPHNESEKGLMMLLNENYKANKKEAELIDFAPSVLGLLGYETPDYMKGKCIFTT